MEIDYTRVSPTLRDGSPNPEYVAQYERNVKTFDSRLQHFSKKLDEVTEQLISTDPESEQWVKLQEELVKTCKNIGDDYFKRVIEKVFFNRAQLRIQRS